ncbi:MAG TPA: hypothetical protein VMB81_21710 [Candidatus Sulfotelmatobacter sp.]|nr:hypothetical protein [Candidatus Sulfotelmatobacter sp.]
MVAKRPARTANERAAGPDAPPAGDADIVPRVRRAVHDLRQPVQAMRLFVHLLSSRLEREEDRALVVKLDEALENIEAALRGLMDSVAPAAGPATGRPPTDR